MNQLYKNKDWLENKYDKGLLSDSKIAKVCDVDNSTIYRWRKKFNILARSLGEGQHLATSNHCFISKEANEWINGELLGDGCLVSLSSYSASFVYTSSSRKYINYVSNILKFFGISRMGKINSRFDGSYFSYYYSSLRYEELLPIYKKWYPNGKKIVPRSIKLTPLTIRQWYLGDGCLLHPKDCRPYIELCTCGFTILDVNWLIKQLVTLGFKTTRKSFDNTIYISVRSTMGFLDYIGPCPVKHYQYKWNYNKRKEFT